MTALLYQILDSVRVLQSRVQSLSQLPDISKLIIRRLDEVVKRLDDIDKRLAKQPPTKPIPSVPRSQA